MFIVSSTTEHVFRITSDFAKASALRHLRQQDSMDTCGRLLMDLYCLIWGTGRYVDATSPCIHASLLSRRFLRLRLCLSLGGMGACDRRISISIMELHYCLVSRLIDLKSKLMRCFSTGSYELTNSTPRDEVLRIDRLCHLKQRSRGTGNHNRYHLTARN